MDNREGAGMTMGGDFASITIEEAGDEIHEDYMMLMAAMAERDRSQGVFGR